MAVVEEVKNTPMGKVGGCVYYDFFNVCQEVEQEGRLRKISNGFYLIARKACLCDYHLL